MQSNAAEESDNLTHLQKRFIDLGFKGLNEQDTIELIFSLTLPPEESIQLAQECLNKYGSLCKLLAANTAKLQSIGVPYSAIVSLRLLHDMPIQVLRQKIIEKPTYHSSREIFKLLRYSMLNLEEEVLKVIFCDEHDHITDIEDLFTGSKHNITVSPRAIIEKALERNIENLIFVHNHTSGNPNPSKTDIIFTRDMVFLGSLLQINILDHIIIGDVDYYSFADSGKLQQFKDNFINMKIKGIISASNLHPDNSIQSLSWNVIPRTISQDFPTVRGNASSPTRH
jgi:DNA repair protein RadC